MLILYPDFFINRLYWNNEVDSIFYSISLYFNLLTDIWNFVQWKKNRQKITYQWIHILKNESVLHNTSFSYLYQIILYH
jgi:hypothetical protein